MSYRSESISTTLTKLNHAYFLQAIQREYVWRSEQIIQLFDSILRRYPIGSFRFWELDKGHKEQWDAYRFLDNGRQGGSHNVLAITDGAPAVTLILEGQQRLTSLMVGLKGFYEVKRKYKRWDDPDAWAKQRLYINLLNDPIAPANENLDSDVGLYYDLQFLDDQPVQDAEHYWFPVGKILSVAQLEQLDDFIDREEEFLPDGVTKGGLKTFARNLERLYDAIWKDEAIAYYTERDQDYDRVLDIFVRANEGGTKLSKFDLLLSMVTSK